jgi:hypothetical protein
LEEKLGRKNHHQKESNLELFQKNTMSLKKSHRDDIKILRPSNSFIGMKVASTSANFNPVFKKTVKEMQKQASEVKSPTKQLIGNLIINSNIFSPMKAKSSIFTTQIY